jgi:hypothetical protein
MEQKFFPSGEKVEFHAQAITAHREEPGHSTKAETRTAIIEALCDVVSNSSRGVTLFGVAVEKASNKEPLLRAFEEICNRFYLFLQRLRVRGDTQRRLIIFDETRYESVLQTLLKHYRETGSRFGKMSNFADVPFFADSKSTRMLQLANLIAYTIFRRYERSNT